MASSRDAIVISDDEDGNYEDVDDEIEEIPPPKHSSADESRTRKRTEESSPPSDNQSKRMRSENPFNSQYEEGDAAGSVEKTGPVPGPYFESPQNTVELMEEIVLPLLDSDDEHGRSNTKHDQLRRLGKFTFFESKGSLDNPGSIIGLHWIEIDGHPPISAHGEVSLADAEVVNDEDIPSREIILGRILEWWSGDGFKDAELYIRSEHGWYLLEEPSEAYCRHYREFWLPHRLSQIITNFALKAPDAGLAELGDHLVRTTHEARLMIGRKATGITLEDVEQWMPVIQRDLNYLKEKSSFQPLFATRLAREIFATPKPEPSRRLKSISASRSAHSPRGIESDSSPRTVVTPLVSRIAQRYYKHLFDVIGSSPPTFDSSCQEDFYRDAKDTKLRIDPETEGRITKTYYESVHFEKKSLYKVGDSVALVPGKLKDYEFPQRPNVSSDCSHAKDHWYGIIKRIYQKLDPQAPHEHNFWVHIQWFLHGVDTDIGEMAAPAELFLTYECSDVGMACIEKVVNVRFESAASEEIIPENREPDVLFCRFLYSEVEGCFTDISLPPPHKYTDLDFDQSLDGRERALHCDACIHQRYAERIVNENAFMLDSSPPYRRVNVANTTYHLHDTILYYDQLENRGGENPSPDLQALSVGWIKEWKLTGRHIECLVQKLRYIDEILYRPCQATDVIPAKTQYPLDERRLFLTPEVTKVEVGDIVRHCVVHCKPQWVPHSNLDSESDEFFLTHHSRGRPRIHDQSGNFQYSISRLEPIQLQQFTKCKECKIKQDQIKKNRQPFKDNAAYAAKGEVYPQARYMKTMDLCAGGGGLSIGVEKSGAFRIFWAIEKDVSSARTYRVNFPRTKLYIQDLNECARSVLDPDTPLLKSLDPRAKGPLLSMPAAGEVEAIVAGPPCPDFSIQNRFRDRAGETRTGLPLVVLSLIEHYRPRYFLLENVLGMLRHECIDQETGKPISYAVVKIMLRAFTTLGYSVRYGIFNAANYGTPQDRARLVFYGSRGGYALPRVPKSSHITIKHAGTTFSRFTGIPTKVPDSEATSQPTNLAAAIGDLPPFEWTVARPPFPPRANVPTCPGESRQGRGLAGFVGGAPYKRSKPNSLYQAKMREHVEAGGLVQFHYTTTFAEDRSLKAARVIAVPLRANMDHRNIPPELNDFAHSHALSAAARTLWAPGRYGRLDWQGLFQSAITRIEPTAKQGKVLHPSQRRLISIREAARAQGIPDHYEFRGSPADIIRMIGNSVPVPFGEAFGRAFRDAMIGQRIWEELKIGWPKDA